MASDPGLVCIHVLRGRLFPSYSTSSQNNKQPYNTLFLSKYEVPFPTSAFTLALITDRVHISDAGQVYLQRSKEVMLV